MRSASRSASTNTGERLCRTPACRRAILRGRYCIPCQLTQRRERRQRRAEKRKRLARGARLKAAWSRIRQRVLVGHCGVEDCARLLRRPEDARVDHIVPRALAMPQTVDHPDNLLELCVSCHGRKARAEIRLHRGDLLGFWTELLRLGWPMGRVRRALELNGYSVDFATG